MTGLAANVIGIIGLTVAVMSAVPGYAQQADSSTQPAVEPSGQVVSAAPGLAAETSAILTVDQDRLYSESAWGKRAAAEIEAESLEIAAENQRLFQQLSDEEAALTKLRDTLSPAEFRKKAEAFDSRATEIRRERAQVLQELTARADADRTEFFRMAVPVMGEAMMQRGAVALLDYRSVLVSMETIDITDDLIQELNTEIGASPPADEEATD